MIVISGNPCHSFRYCTLDPDDFTTVAGEIVFLPEGETEMCEMIPIEDDDVQEPSENFDVVFTPDSPGAPPSTATVTIFDNDQIGKHTILFLSFGGKNCCL